MKYIIIFLALLSILQAEMPVVDAGAAKLLLDQLHQGTQALQQLQQQLQTANNIYHTAQYALKYQGNPAAVLGAVKDASLDGILNHSGVTSTFDRLLGSLNNASNISYQLENLVGPSISVESVKTQLLAGQSITDNLAKYQAMERLFSQQNQQLQLVTSQENSLRYQLFELRSQLASSPDQATTEKLSAAITSVSAALDSTDSTLEQLHQQTQISAQMIQNRKLMEDAAYQQAYQELAAQQAHASSASIRSGFQNINKNR